MQEQRSTDTTRWVRSRACRHPHVDTAVSRHQTGHGEAKLNETQVKVGLQQL